MDNELPAGPPPEPISPSDAPSAEVVAAQPLAIAPTVSVPEAQIPQYRDRSTGLVIFGVFQIILGLLAALMVPFAALGAFLSRLAPGATMRPAQALSGMATYALIAIGLLILGVGSLQYKRWARALTLVVSWYWLITGILLTVLLTAVLPVTMKSAIQAQEQAAGQSQSLPEGVMAVILTVIIVFAAIFLIFVPIAFVAFYGRKDVGETCRHRDPVERWTDRVPLPVLGASVVLAVQSFYLLFTGISTPLFPFFGHYLTGIRGVACFVAFALLDGSLALALYWLKPAGWWIAVIATPIRICSLAFTYARADLMQAYSKMGFSDAQMRMLHSNPMLRGHVVLWWSLISAVLFFGYLLWLKRYFNAPRTAQQQALPAEV